MPEDFLLKQMDWHESLEEAQEFAQVEQLSKEVHLAIEVEMSRCEEMLRPGSNWDEERLGESLRAWVFMDRFLESVKSRASLLQTRS